MNKRTFNKLCRIQFGKRKKGELPLTDEEKHDMVLHIVKHRGPISKELITDLVDKECRTWLNCMGYLSENAEFIHTSEQKMNKKR